MEGECVLPKSTAIYMLERQPFPSPSRQLPTTDRPSRPGSLNPHPAPALETAQPLAGLTRLHFFLSFFLHHRFTFPSGRLSIFKIKKMW